MSFPLKESAASRLYLLLSKNYFWWAMLAVLLFPFVVLAMYNHPSADDYCYVVDAANRGFWQSQWTTYQNWTGRYVSTFLLVSSPLAIGSFLGYKMISFLLLLLTVISCLFFVKTILNKKQIDVSVIAVSFSMVLLYLFKMPSLTEGFYWLSGAITYQLANIAALIAVTLLLSIRKTEKYNWKVVAAVLLCVIICGANETSMLEFVYVLVALIAFEYASTRSVPKYYYLLLIVSLIAASIIILAPGNAVRAAYFQGEKNILKALLLAATSGLHRLQDWAFSSFLLLILFLPFLKQVEVKTGTDERKIKPVVLILYPLFMAGILIVGYFPAFWSLGFEPPVRTVNVLYFLFLAVCFHYVVLCITYIKQKGALFIAIPVWVQWVLLLLLFRSMAPQNHYRTGTMDLVSGRAKAYDLEMEKRYLQMKKHEHEDVVFKPLTKIPTSIFFVDIEAEHPEDWKNVCTSDYFHLKSLNLTKTTE